MSRHERSGGFTLIELLVVITVIGILVGFGAVRTDSVKARAFVATMRADLSSIVVAQEVYYDGAWSYTPTVGDLAYTPSAGVQVTLRSDSTGWTAQTTHPQASGRECAIYVGNIAPLSPASKPGIIECKTTVKAPGCS